MPAHALQRGELSLGATKHLGASLGTVGRAGLWRVRRGQLHVPADVGFRLTARIEQMPDRANRIRLSGERDRFGKPKMLLEWGPKAQDERGVRPRVLKPDE